MKKKNAVYFAAVFFLSICCIFYSQYHKEKTKDNTNTVSGPQISSIKTELSEKSVDSFTLTKHTTCAASKKIYITSNVPTCVTTCSDIITEVITQAETQAVSEPVDKSSDIDQSENQNDDNAYDDSQQQPVDEPQDPEPGAAGEIQNAPSATEFQREVLRLVNSLRSQEGITEMSSTDILNQAAQVRADEVSETFSHERPDGSSYSSVLDQLGISGWTNGENIAAGPDTPQEVVSSWMDSPGHRNNIMNPSFTMMGTGFCAKSDEYGEYWVQLFIG